MSLPNRKLDVLAALPGPEIARAIRRSKYGTAVSVAGELGLSTLSVRRYLRQLYDAELAHIGCWTRSSTGFNPIWVRGKGQHAPKPDPRTGAEHSRRSRARIKKRNSGMAGRKNDSNMGQKEQVLEFVRANPQTTTKAISSALGFMPLSRVGMYLIRLDNAGLVIREKIKGDPLLRWSALELGDCDVSESQVTTQDWAPQNGRDPLTAALFGPAGKP